MTRFDIFDTIEQLRRAGQPFCVATVVRTADVTSAKAGAKAAITASGDIVGHLGGACVQRAVRRAATEALAQGDARMISVRPAEKAAAQADIEVHSSGCPSGGTVDLFIEPYSMPPQLIILGDTPIGRAIATHGALMGFDVRALGTTSDIAAGQPDFIVIASQGSGDGDAIKASLASDAGTITMIASQRKADALREKLLSAGVSSIELDRIKAPAGLDLGGIDPHEIAVSVLAEIIQIRRSRQSPYARHESVQES